MVWKTYEFKAGEVKYWQVGSLQLWIHRGEDEWKVVSDSADDPLASGVETQSLEALPTEEDHKDLRRYALDGGKNALQLIPRLPNRAIVAKPETPFYIPSSHETSLYISIPLWIQIFLAKENVMLEEIASYRLSDSWFGPSPVEGELCYGVKTKARLHFKEMPLRPHRVITSVSIKNASSEPLFLERLKIPVTNLSLYESEGGNFFTEGLQYERQKSGEGVKMSLKSVPPQIVGSCKKTGGPREKLERNLVLKTVKSLFS